MQRTLKPYAMPFRQHIIPFDCRANQGANPGQSATMFPMDVSTGTKPGTVESVLFARFGYAKDAIDIEALEFDYFASDATALPAGAAALKSRWAIVQRDSVIERSASLMGVPNGVLLGHTGLGVSWGTAQDSYNSNATNQQGMRFEMSGGLCHLPARTPFAVFGLCQVGYSNVATPDLCGQTPTTTTTTPGVLGWFLPYDTAALPNHRGSRLGSQLYGRSMIYIQDLITTAIDSWDWATATLNGSISAINWLAYSAAQIQGTADWAVIAEGALAGGTTINLTAGAQNIRSSIQSASIFLTPPS